MQIVRRAVSEAALLTGAIRVEAKRAHKRVRAILFIEPSARIKNLRMDTCANDGAQGGLLLVF